MIPTCKELAEGLAADRVERLGLFDRLRYRFHGWICPPCRLYVQQIQSIGAAARENAQSTEPTPSALRTMQGRCLEKLKARETQARPGSDAANARDSD